MRADVNVSVRKPGDELGTRTETKNVNSVRFVMAVVEQEARRQVDVIEDGGTIVQETRLYDPDRNETRSMRSKEDAHDYRYFPDPDLLPLELDDAFLDECRASLPELPDAKRRRYETALGLSAYNAGVLTAEAETARWFEALLGERRAAKPAGAEIAKQAANWLIVRAVRRAQPARHAPSTTRRSRRRRRPNCWRWSPTARSRARSPSRCSRRCSKTGDGAARDRRARGPEADLATPARSRRPSPRCSPTTPTSSSSTRRQGSAVRLLRRPDDEGDAGQGQPASGQRVAEEGACRLTPPAPRPAGAAR